MTASAYFNSLITATGNCWNRFWFEPLERKPLDRLRVIMGIIALYLLVTLTPDLSFYFGPDGLLPVEAVDQLSINEAGSRLRGWSYLDYFQSPAELLTLHIVGIVIVALFTFGIFTPVTSVGALAVMLSTAHRAPMITTMVEPVVTMVLFYLCLGPAGPIAGITKFFTQRPIERVSTWSTVSLRLIQLHVALLYGTMALSKLLSESWWNGTGVWWLIARPESRWIDLAGLAEWNVGRTAVGIYLINLWTHAIVAFDLMYAVLIWNRLLRPLLVGWSIVHWTGIALLLGQPLLALTMIGMNAAYCQCGGADNNEIG